MSRDGLMKFNASLTHLHFEMLDSLQAFKGDIAPVPEMSLYVIVKVP